MRDNNIARRAFTRHIHGWKMASLFTRVSKTPVKILRVSVDDCCRVCNVHFATYGCIGRFNLFQGKNSRERNVAGRLSLVLGFPVIKESGMSSVICIKCKRELEKLETLENSLTKFCQKALESTAAQRERGYVGEQEKRCHRSSPTMKSPTKSPLAKKSATQLPFRGRPKQILKPSNVSNCLVELPFHEEIAIPIKPTKITSTVKVRNYEINRRSKAKSTAFLKEHKKLQSRSTSSIVVCWFHFGKTGFLSHDARYFGPANQCCRYIINSWQILETNTAVGVANQQFYSVLISRMEMRSATRVTRGFIFSSARCASLSWLCRSQIAGSRLRRSKNKTSGTRVIKPFKTV